MKPTTSGLSAAIASGAEVAALASPSGLDLPHAASPEAVNEAVNSAATAAGKARERTETLNAFPIVAMYAGFGFQEFSRSRILFVSRRGPGRLSTRPRSPKIAVAMTASRDWLGRTELHLEGLGAAYRSGALTPATLVDQLPPPPHAPGG